MKLMITCGEATDFISKRKKENFLFYRKFN